MLRKIVEIPFMLLPLALCAGCVPPVSTAQLSASRYEMKADYDFFNPSYGAQDTLNRRALAQCNGAYRLLNSSAEGTGTTGKLIWIFRCEEN